MFFFFKQKTAYEMRISDWSSDVCSSDLLRLAVSAVDPGIEVRGDRRALKQVLLNLLSNAVKFTECGGAVTLTAKRSEGGRAEARRVGKECVSTCRSRGSPAHKKKNKHQKSLTRGE